MQTLQQDLGPALQAAGHLGAQSGSGLFVKPTNQTEIDFYTKMVELDSPLLDICPTYMGKMEPKKEGSKPCVVLGDMLHDFVNPSILDLKLGSILWDSKADAAKVQRLKAVADSTTSGSLGFRITGMSVVQADGERKSYDKQYGREGCTASNIGEYLLAFFPVVNDYTRAVKDVMQQHLEHLLGVVSETPVEMHSASILMVYEGDMAALKHKVDNQDDLSEVESDSDGEGGSKNGIVAVKLIDFGHATFVDEPYKDLVWGIENVVKEWENLKLKD